MREKDGGKKATAVDIGKTRREEEEGRLGWRR